MSLQSEIDRLGSAKDALKAAIQGKGVDVPDEATISDYPELVDQIVQGGSLFRDINFYDYDGTLLYTFSSRARHPFTELPPLPNRAGLICQGWNWTLEALQSINHAMDIGAMYITEDGATRLYIKIASDGRRDVPLYFSQTLEGAVVIDWGDGGDEEAVGGTGYVDTTHTYAEPGDYVISLMPMDECKLGLGSGTNAYCVLGDTSDAGTVYRNMLRKVEIGRAVETIGPYAFMGCFSLENVSIPYEVMSVGAGAFSMCYSLISVVVSDGIKRIENTAFSNCTSMVSVSLPYGLTSIGQSAFNGCMVLPSIALPDTLTVVAGTAFQSCFALASITLPDTVTSIENFAFSACYALRNIRMSTNLSNIGYQAFGNCYALTRFVIPAGATRIRENTFLGCRSLVSVVIPETVTSIGFYAFQHCYSLESITLPAGTNVINYNAFQNCRSLANIKIPAGVQTIAANTFLNCVGMAYYDFTEHTSVPALDNVNAFTGIPDDCVIKVPAALEAAWKAAANWSTYASHIVGV